MKNWSIRKIKKQSIARYLVEDIERRARLDEATMPENYERPLLKEKPKKVVKDSVWWLNFIRSNVEQFRP